MGIAERNPYPGVLAITADIRFYSKVMSAVDLLSWGAKWARTMSRAIEIYERDAMPVVIYDIDLPDIEWHWAFDRLSIVPKHPRLLLAARSVDEDLWRRALRHHGYDVIERSANAETLSRALRFAWLSLFITENM